MALDHRSLPKLVREGNFFYCSNCNQHVTSKTTGYRHVKVCMEQCPPAKEIYDDDKLLEDISNSLKTEDVPDVVGAHQCMSCQKTFKLRHSLYKHEKYCGINYSFATNKEEDVEEEILNCKNCGQSFESSSMLNRHERTCETNLFICNECGDSFDSIKELCIHELSHSTEKIEKEVNGNSAVASDEKPHSNNYSNGHTPETVTVKDEPVEAVEDITMEKIDITENEVIPVESVDMRPNILNKVDMHPNILNKVDMHPNFWNKIDMRPTILNKVDMDPSILNKVDMNPSILNKVDMHPNIPNKIDMRPTILNKVDMHPNIFDKVDMRSTILNKVDMRPTILNKVDMRPTILNKVDMRPTILNKVDMRPNISNKVDMHPTILNKVEMHPTNLNKVDRRPNMNKVDMHPTILNKVDMRPNILNKFDMHPTILNKVDAINGKSEPSYIDLNQRSVEKMNLDDPFNLVHTIGGVKEEIEEEQYTVVVIENDGSYNEELSFEANGVHVNGNSLDGTGSSVEYPCQFCEKLLKSRSALEKHEQKCRLDHDKKFLPKLVREDGKLYCGRCGLHVTSKTTGYRHQKICSQREEETLKKLSECSSQSVVSDSSTKGTDGGVYHCNICLRNFSYGQSFQKHVKFCGSTNHVSKKLKLENGKTDVTYYNQHNSSAPVNERAMEEDCKDLSVVKTEYEISENINGIGEDTIVVIANESLTDNFEEQIDYRSDVEMNGNNDPMNQSMESNGEYNCKFCNKSCNGRTAMMKHQNRCKFNVGEKEKVLPKLVREGDRFYCGRCGAHVTSKTTGYRHVKMCLNNTLFDSDNSIINTSTDAIDDTLNDTMNDTMNDNINDTQNNSFYDSFKNKTVEDIPPAVSDPIRISDDGTFKCNVCLRGFTYRQSFQKHVKVCGANNPYRESRGMITNSLAS